MPEVKAENSQRNLEKHLDTTSTTKVDFSLSCKGIEGQGPPAAKNVKKV